MLVRVIADCSLPSFPNKDPSLYSHGKYVHRHLIQPYPSLNRNIQINNALLNFYGKFGKIRKVRSLYKKHLLPNNILNVVTLNTLIKVSTENGYPKKALKAFEELISVQETGKTSIFMDSTKNVPEIGGAMTPTGVTFLEVFRACVVAKKWKYGRNVATMLLKDHICDGKGRLKPGIVKTTG